MTYQRPHYLKRQLQFFKDLGSDFRLIILDGSKEISFLSQNELIAKEYKAEYYNKVNPAERMVLFSEKLDTEFAAWSADDDLIVPSFYNAGVLFLQENKQYSVVAGKTYTLHYNRTQPWKGYFLRNYLGNTYDFFYGDFAEKMIRRDQSYALGCPPTFYGVRKYDNVQLFCKYVNKLKINSSMERLENICNILHGGMKVINVLMGFRDYSSEPIRQTERADPEIYISKEDIVVLEDVIRNELKNEIKNKEMLEYYVSYAWLLPLRPAQGNEMTDTDNTLNWRLRYSWKLRIESLANLLIAHRFHAFDKTVTKALRRNMLNKHEFNTGS